MAAVGADWRYRGRPLGAEIGSETVRPRRRAHHGVPALGPVGEHASLEYVEEAYVEVKAVEEQQALLSEELSKGVEQSVQTESHPHVGCQDIGQEELFVGRRRAPRAAGSFM